MEVCHVESAVFDDPNLVSCAGLGPVVALAEQCGLPQLVAAQLTLPAKAGVNAHLKVPALVGAMVAGADSIADTDLLRPGGMDRLFGEVRAPSTLGTFLRAFTFGHVRQLDAVAGQLLAELSRRSPLLPGADRVRRCRYRRHRESHIRLRQAGRRLRLLRGEGPQRAARDGQQPTGGAGDRRDPAPEGLDELRAGRPPAGRRRAGGREGGRGWRAAR